MNLFYKPAISKNSTKIAKEMIMKKAKNENDEEENVYSRLYEIKSPKKKQSKYRKKVLPKDGLPLSDDSDCKNEEESVFFTERKKADEINHNFSPDITNRAKKIVRKEKIVDFLYNDASKRLENKLSLMNSSQMTSNEQNFISKSTSDKILQRFFKEFLKKMDEVNPNKKKYLKLIFLINIEKNFNLSFSNVNFVTSEI